MLADARGACRVANQGWHLTRRCEERFRIAQSAQKTPQRDAAAS